MNRLLLGRYIPGDSIIHKLDPRCKLVAGFYLIGLIFFCHTWWSYGLMVLFIGCCIALSKMKLSFFLRGIRSMIWLILFTVLLQILFSTGQHVYVHWGVFNITQEGIVNGCYVFMRFVLIICISTILTVTTSSLALADATESLLRPFGKLGLPVHEIALMLSIALRFIPTLTDEAEKIMNAQRSRGVDFDSGSLWTKVKAMIPLLIPLFVSCFNRAEELADAMEARGYQGGEGRSKYRQLVWHRRDTVSVIVIAALTIGIMMMR